MNPLAQRHNAATILSMKVTTIGSEKISGTILGALAIVFWSASVGISRSLAEKLGILTSSMLIYLFAGLLGCLNLAARGKLRKALRLPKAYLLGCGALFVLYLTCFCLAIGLARDGQQVVEIGLCNYLWPSLTLVFSIFLLGHRASWLLLPGMVLSFLGIFVASLGGQALSMTALSSAFSVFWQNASAHPAPYLLALVAAVTWSLYSNLNRLFASTIGVSAVPLFLLASGLALAVIRMFVPEESRFDPGTMVELSAMILFPALLAYIFWERAMHSGQMILVTALSYFIPLFSTILLCLMQGLTMGPALWLSCALIIAGAALCKLALTEPLPNAPSN